MKKRHLQHYHFPQSGLVWADNDLTLGLGYCFFFSVNLRFLLIKIPKRKNSCVGVLTLIFSHSPGLTWDSDARWEQTDTRSAGYISQCILFYRAYHRNGIQIQNSSSMQRRKKSIILRPRGQLIIFF